MNRGLGKVRLGETKGKPLSEPATRIATAGRTVGFYVSPALLLRDPPASLHDYLITGHAPESASGKGVIKKPTRAEFVSTEC